MEKKNQFDLETRLSLLGRDLKSVTDLQKNSGIFRQFESAWLEVEAALVKPSYWERAASRLGNFQLGLFGAKELAFASVCLAVLLVWFVLPMSPSLKPVMVAEPPLQMAKQEAAVSDSGKEAEEIPTYGDFVASLGNVLDEGFELQGESVEYAALAFSDDVPDFNVENYEEEGLYDEDQEEQV